jgi:hypothetical protein
MLKILNRIDWGITKTAKGYNQIYLKFISYKNSDQ